MLLLVPFQYCYSLIGSREYNLYYGNVEIDCKNWKHLLISIYGTYLKIVLKEMKTNMYVEHTLNDIRINQIMKMIKQSTYTESILRKNKSKFDISQIHEESILFPLCMRSLYISLIKNNRLAHNERYFFLNK